MKDSKSYYNKIANAYGFETKTRLPYLNSVDDFIIKSSSQIDVNNYLDIGSGDGRRSLKIANKVAVQRKIILVDNSDKMLESIKGNENVSIFNMPINSFNSMDNFNLITCLWNVLGHFPNKSSRVELFKKVDTLLEKNGIFIFDVNNRYNISHYGVSNVAKNLELDHFGKDNIGWFSLGEKPYQTKVYIHSPFDIEEYIFGTSLVLDDIKYIDYSTGLEKSTFFEGQLLYKLKKK